MGRRCVSSFSGLKEDAELATNVRKLTFVIEYWLPIISHVDRSILVISINQPSTVRLK